MTGSSTHLDLAADLAVSEWAVLTWCALHRPGLLRYMGERGTIDIEDAVADRIVDDFGDVGWGEPCPGREE